MHKAAKSTKGFGFDVDNTIGSTPQINTWTSDWIEFFGVHRLGYQLKLIRQQYGDSLIYEKGQRLVKNMAPLFDGAVLEPCLLHGDLWSGNISSDKNGEPVILDPACYYGHNEAEFGMSWCAGFGGSFYNAYFESRMEVETVTETSTVAAEMVAALEQATLMAKQLPTATDPSQLLRILTTLHSAHHRLSLFLSNHQPTPPPENSVSSAVDGGGEPMLLGDDEEEHNSGAATSSAVEKVAGRMRDCFIQNKRPKRPLSASAEMRQSFENGAETDGPVDGPAAEFDPHGNKSRSLDLIYQFHA